MKPITLTIAGLHSFREKQVIDFETLCEGGVFGIFGPTGSGKSSILDAMTLALYGKVERAANNTQGIMNHAEDQLAVSLTFELENATNKKRYIVERSFKRSDELRVKTATSRLIEEGKETFVLADKTGDVNSQVQDLLGLTIDDFTRAVVLPQGKFAEFLSLKGADRRQMLQRLFHLEQYGDKLNKKLKDRLSLSKGELNEITAEQAGLGDASKTAIKQAEKELKESEILLSKRQVELQQMEVRFEKQKQLWTWQQEKETIEKRLREAEKEEEQMIKLEEKLKRAVQADKVKPYLEDYERTKEAVSKAKTKLEALQTKLTEIKSTYEQAVKQYNAVRAEKTEKEPILVARKEQLHHAKAIQDKVTQLKQEVTSLQHKQKNLTEKAAKNKQQIEQAVDIHKRSIEKQVKLKEELAGQTVSADYREQARKAFEEKQDMKRIETSLNEYEQSAKRKQQHVKELEVSVQKAEKELLQTKQRAQTIFTSIEKIFHHVCEREVELEKLIAFGENLFTKLKQQLEHEQVQHLAVELSHQLKEGEACPVCGSYDHPNPVPEVQSSTEVIAEKIQALETLLGSSQEEKHSIASLKFQLEQLSQYVIEELQDEITSGTHSLHPVVDNLEGKSNKIEAIAVYLKSIVTESKSLKQDYVQEKEESQKVVQQLRSSRQKIQQDTHSLKLATADLSEVETKVSEFVQTITKQKEVWQETYPNFAMDEIEKAQKNIANKDQAAQELKKRIDTSVTFIEEKAQEIERFKEEYHALERQIVDIATTERNKSEQLKENADKLDELVGTNDVNVLLKETIDTLQDLSERESAVYDHWQKTQKILQQVESETIASKQSLTEHESRYEQSKLYWEDILSQTAFETAANVKASLLTTTEQTQLKEQIELFWDKIKQLRAELKKLTELIKNEAIIETEWLETQQLLKEMKDSVSTAVEAKGAATKALSDLQEKHERFNELEERRKQLEELVEQYNKLQSVFKGNSFVEFVAEEQLMQVSRDASERLGILTRRRYAIEVDSQGGFIMRDDANGGVKRPVTTLSGGETFLTSLALALSLSAQIQLRGEYPLQFFFLDEGFGTLDADLLETVVSALEKLHSHQLSVGVISHVQELRARLPKKLVVEPAEPSGRGSTVKLEFL